MLTDATPIECAHDTILRCPRCRDEYPYLHHVRVEIFARSSEDAPRGLHVVQEVGAPLRIDADAETSNPSSRRDGLRIVFWCENCDQYSSLAIAQHKGQTFVFWHEPDTWAGGLQPVDHRPAEPSS